MNRRAVSAIARKDLKVVLQNKGVVLPILIAPLVLFGALPWMAALAPNLANVGGMNVNELRELLAHMPEGLRTEMALYTPDQQPIVFFLVYMLAPLFLILPVMTSSVMAADSFAGERERRTLETLLYTPTTDRELFVGKLLAPWLAAMVVSAVGFVLYVVMANAAAGRVMGSLFFPTLMWVVLVVWVAPAAAGFGLATMVLVSVRAQGFQDAYQVGSIVVLPLLLLLFGQISGVMYFSIGAVLLLGLGLWVTDVVLIWAGSRVFRRGRLIARS
ncbi:MAG: ABC transporter permease subunit [Anaerolineae bacterium]|nr:ABC transporter permease subunit [Thermoflexales bacterium]MDW8407230.1 ABC transporter permease subunit [Anaerolineae bacterium]